MKTCYSSETSGPSDPRRLRLDSSRSSAHTGAAGASTRSAQDGAPAAPEKGSAGEPEAGPRSIMDEVFGMTVLQRTQCLAGPPAERTRESRSFQVGAPAAPGP